MNASAGNVTTNFWHPQKCTLIYDIPWISTLGGLMKTH